MWGLILHVLIYIVYLRLFVYNNCTLAELQRSIKNTLMFLLIADLLKLVVKLKIQQSEPK